MDGFNKYQAITVAVILMFGFVVAAIYTNTKDASAQKNLEKSAQVENSQTITTDSIKDLYNEIEFLKERFESLKNEVSETNKSGDFSCKVYGVMTESGVEEQLPSEALRNARDNDAQLVLTCDF
ncbi:MAG: hypothetical protein E7Z87_00685 [Cyanobacteria bacterium SIG26]|nr:hypothetical protein [Cyanobacteria bacterium SIG26]